MRQCPHCEPIKANDRHFAERITLSLGRIVLFLIWPVRPLIKLVRPTYMFLSAYITLFIVSLGSLTHVLVKRIPLGDSQVQLRTKLFTLASAKRRLLVTTFYFLGKYPTPLCLLQKNHQRFLFETIPSAGELAISSFAYDNKMEFKKLLARHHLPFVRGASFLFFYPAFKYAQRLLLAKVTLVIKPLDGSLSKHTFVNINSKAEARKAIKSVLFISLFVLVEEYVEGFNFRATMVGFNQVAVAKRLPPTIVGDGQSTIAQLLEAKNVNKLRGPTNSRNHALHQVVVNDFLLGRLARQGYNLATVLAKNEACELSGKINLASGADIYDVTATVYPHNRALFERVATLLGEPIVGLDIIAEDLGVSYLRKPIYIIEANPKPFFEMHHFPLEGESRDVAGALADLYAS